MEKISGIIPASARTKVADTSLAQPARPGAPALGRPMGKNSLGDRVTLSKQMEEMKATGMMPTPEETPAVYKNPAEARKLKVVDDLNAKFFNAKALAKEGEEPKSEEALKKLNQNEGLFFVEKELRPAQPAPLKETTDTKIA